MTAALLLAAFALHPLRVIADEMPGFYLGGGNTSLMSYSRSTRRLQRNTPFNGSGFFETLFVPSCDAVDVGQALRRAAILPAFLQTIFQSLCAWFWAWSDRP
jgi:hypothetical protein